MRRPSPPEPLPSPFLALLNSPHRRNSNNRSEPSFINYKTTENERNKIYKLIYDSPRKRTESTPPPPPPSSKRSKEKSQAPAKKKSEPFPK